MYIKTDPKLRSKHVFQGNIKQVQDNMREVKQKHANYQVIYKYLLGKTGYRCQCIINL